MQNSKYIVYALVDPRDLSIFYVGKSCSGIKKMLRHTQPHSLREGCRAKNKRILEILSENLNPMYIILTTARNKDELSMKERVLIAKYAEQFKLTNVQVNR